MKVQWVLTTFAIVALAACSSDADAGSGSGDSGNGTGDAATTGGTTGNGTTGGDTTGGQTTGGETTGGETTGGETAGGETTGGVDWENMDFNARQAYMASTVLPTMTTLFQAFDDDEFKNFGCGTCHQGGLGDGSFSMPNSLHPFDPAALPTPDSADPEEAAFAKFMMEKVAPKMIELLGAEPFDPATGEGFGCFSCHATK